MLWLLVGESGSGKTSLEKKMVENGKAKRIISYTTRFQRHNEENGVDYFFISKKEFLYLKANGKLLEAVEYNGNFYGASIDIDYVNNNYIIVVEPSGAREIKRKLGNNCQSVYILTIEQIRKERMQKRGNSFDQIIDRIVNDRKTFKGFEKEADFIIYNDHKTLFLVASELGFIIGS